MAYNAMCRKPSAIIKMCMGYKWQTTSLCKIQFVEIHTLSLAKKMLH